MRFLVDECLPTRFSRRLIELGHDATRAAENGRGQSDLWQARAALEQERILVSADYDFGELAIRQLEPFVGLVLIAPRENGLMSVAVELAEQVHTLAATLNGHLTVIEADRVRRRPLTAD